MKILRNSLTISAYVLLLGIFFAGGYAFGKTSVEKSSARERQEQVMNNMPMTAAESYEVVAENGRLCLYRTAGEQRELIAAEEISLDIFPEDDAAELKTGVFFDNLGGAQAMFENFVS